MMIEEYIIFICAQVFLILLGISLLHIIQTIHNRKKRNQTCHIKTNIDDLTIKSINDNNKVSPILEDAIYKAKVRQEINDIIK
jgi:hypothetical protein